MLLRMFASGIGIAGGVCQELPVPSVHVKGYLIGSLISEIESVLWEINSIPEDSQHHCMCKQLLYSHRPCSQALFSIREYNIFNIQ